MRKFLIALVIVLIVIFFACSGYFIFDTIKNNNKTKQPETKTLSSLKKYGISLNDKDTELFKTEYDNLKLNINSKEINKDEYAESVAKLFIIDLYTIDNKINKYDVGGSEFVLPKNVDNYKLNVTDTIYKYIEDNTDGKRIQNLPSVSSIEIVDTKKDKYEIKGDKTYDCYKFKLKWDYVTDLGYDKEGEVIVIEKDHKMYVVEKN